MHPKQLEAYGFKCISHRFAYFYNVFFATVYTKQKLFFFCFANFLHGPVYLAGLLASRLAS